MLATPRQWLIHPAAHLNLDHTRGIRAYTVVIFMEYGEPLLRGALYGYGLSITNNAVSKVAKAREEYILR